MKKILCAIGMVSVLCVMNARAEDPKKEEPKPENPVEVRKQELAEVAKAKAALAKIQGEIDDLNQGLGLPKADIDGIDVAGESSDVTKLGKWRDRLRDAADPVAELADPVTKAGKFDGACECAPADDGCSQKVWDVVLKNQAPPVPLKDRPKTYAAEKGCSTIYVSFGAGFEKGADMTASCAARIKTCGKQARIIAESKLSKIQETLKKVARARKDVKNHQDAVRDAELFIAKNYPGSAADKQIKKENAEAAKREASQGSSAGKSE